MAVRVQSLCKMPCPGHQTYLVTRTPAWGNPLPALLYPGHWNIALTFTMPAAAAKMAEKRLTVLARHNEALEHAQHIPLDAQPSLASLGGPAQAAAASNGSASTKHFTAADLPTLKMCTRRNGSRWVLGGDHTGQVPSSAPLSPSLFECSVI